MKIYIYRCNNRNQTAACRAGLYPGYITVNGHVIFDDDVLQREVLVTSTQTGFDIEYLNELSHRVQRQNVTFESEAEVFNDFHIGMLPFDVLQKREKVDRRRITEAYYMVNPKNHIRNETVKKSLLKDVDFEHLKKIVSDSVTATEVDKIALPFSCPGCKCGFETEASLKKHIDAKHPEMNPENPRACTICDKILSTEQRLRTHMKTHLQCKVCKAEFKQEHEMILHKKDHTSCKGCGHDFKTLSKLTRHGKCSN